MSLDLSTLNHEQLEAVLTTRGPLLVLAGAGSGKTRVITYRLAYLIQEGVSPKNILCVTFTNKAAHEMQERARGLVGRQVRGATISTFHALGVKILRTYPEEVGLRPGFSITDSAEQIGTIKRILRSLHVDDRRFDAKRILTLIGHAKNAGVNAEQFRLLEGELIHLPEEQQEEEDYQLITIEVYDHYEKALRIQNVVDFDDLLLLTTGLLKSNPTVRAKLQERWHYLMVDEYQDTNRAQLELMRLIAGERQNLCVVGDDDQSIYGWRGADVSNILGFADHFDGAKTVMLLTNYRSTGHILEVANTIIEQNTERYDKRLRAAAGEGDLVRITSVEDEEAEAEGVANAILALMAQGVPPADMAVLFRSNVQSRAVELALRTAHVPYRVVGGMDLFDKREIKDALAYLKLLHNPDDEQSLRRIVNYPSRGIGDTSLKKVDDWARERHISLPEALEQVHQVESLSNRSADAVGEFVTLMREHRRLIGRRKASTLTKKLLGAVRLEETLLASSDNATTAARRVDNMREIIRQVERYEKRIKKSKKLAAFESQLEETEAEEEEDDTFSEQDAASLGGFLSDIALSGMDDSSSKDEQQDRVVLSTIHASKGLEWDNVFLVGVEEELLPHRRTLEGDGEVSEERRLAYVAVTRARKNLTVSYAENRTRFGQIVPRTRSRFLEGLPEESVNMEAGALKPKKTEDEERAIAKDWMAKIRADLESKRTKPVKEETP